MRPAQLRRFALLPAFSCASPFLSFNEAGAAAPVCLADQRADEGGAEGFNEAGAAAPVCPDCHRPALQHECLASMRPAQLRRFAWSALRVIVAVSRASMRPAQLRRFAPIPMAYELAHQSASMRPAQLRRFATRKPKVAGVRSGGFNEAGAAAPVCRRERDRRGEERQRFNEAGAAAPVCLRGQLGQGVSKFQLQ